MKLHVQACLITVLFLPFAGEFTGVQAQEESATEAPAPSPETNAGSGASQDPDPSPESSPGPIVGNPNESVEPLDAWDAKSGGEAEGKKSTDIIAPTPTPGEEEGAGEASDEGEQQAIQAESVQSEEIFSTSRSEYDPIIAAQRPRRIQLSKKQKFRLDRARRVRWLVIQEQRRALEIPGEDPRGEAEIRVCSVNFNNYGAMEDYKRIFKASKLNKRIQIGTSIANAIQRAKCDVVACQGILGLEVGSAKETLEKFAKRLSRESGSEWSSYVGTNNSLIAYNGFLVRSAVGTVDGTTSHHALKFPNFGSFSLKGFSRGPLQLMLRVPGKNGATTRQLFLFSADLRDAFLPKSLGPEKERIQMAEAMRTTIAGMLRAQSETEDPPLIVLLVDRAGPGWSPASLVLDGRTRLIDFTMNGGCTLQDEKKLSCSKAKQHVKELVGLTTEGLRGELKIKTKTVDGKKVKFQILPTAEASKKEAEKIERREAEIYLPTVELDLALERFGHAGKYKSGIVKVANGLPASPLVWAELNW